MMACTKKKLKKLAINVALESHNDAQILSSSVNGSPDKYLTWNILVFQGCNPWQFVAE